jgi:hypothetical protein
MLCELLIGEMVRGGKNIDSLLQHRHEGRGESRKRKEEG